MVALRCLSADTARRSIDGSVLIVIGAAFGLGKALEATGAAAAVAQGVVQGIAGASPRAALFVIYVLTNALTEFLSNAAAAALVFPLGMQVATAMGASVHPFAIAIMMAASASFSTPIGYQTNLMVYGPGGYRFTDYARFGLPLNLLWATVTTLLAPLAFPF
jgi:di/tricarboxylate transporter